MFWPGSNPSDFHKTSEDPNCLIKEDQCKNNNFLDDMLVMAQTLKEISQAKETFIFLLKMVVNLETLVKEIEFLGLVINSVNMTLALPQENILDIQNKCMQLIESPKTTTMELTKLLGKLPFTAHGEFSAGTCNNKFMRREKQILIKPK